MKISPIFTLLLVTCFAWSPVLAGPLASGTAKVDLPEWLDIDQDGVISELERQAYTEARNSAIGSLIDQWDSNGDGRIDGTERDAAVANLKARAEQKLRDLFALAAGEDGVIGFDEFAAVAPAALANSPILKAIYDLIDPNGNGINLDQFMNITQGLTLPSIPSIQFPFSLQK
ncbi:MAG: EF-hand domain-containing protein [Luteolibacter sp.]